MNISFIGFGSMAKAIARGLTNNNKYQLSAAAPSLAIGCTKEYIHTHHDNTQIIKNAEIIILAVKPALMSTVLQEIKPYIPPSCLIISVAAGLSLSYLIKHIGAQHAIIRTMPNTPASVGLAATPMIANQWVTEQQQQEAELIFSAVGLTHWTNNESEMDGFTALSGSGPAYMFSFIEALVDAGVALGLEASIAKQFALQTCKGALKLAENNQVTLSELRAQVTSPGGTTEAALNILQQQLDTLILTAMRAAKERSIELGER